MDDDRMTSMLVGHRACTPERCDFAWSHARITELEAENREQSAELTFCIATIERLGEPYAKLREEWKKARDA